MAAPALDTAAIMASAMFVLIPAIDFNTAASDDREPRLRSIIANIERQNNIVRQNIIRDSLAQIAQRKTQIAEAPQSNFTPEADLDALASALRTPLDPKRVDGYKVPPVVMSDATAAQDLVAKVGLDIFAVDQSWTQNPEINALLRKFDIHHAKTLRFYREALGRTLRDTEREREAEALLHEQVRLEEQLEKAAATATGVKPSKAATDSDTPMPDANAIPLRPNETSQACKDPRRRPSLKTQVSPAPSLQSAPIRSNTDIDDTRRRPSTGLESDPRLQRRSSIQVPSIAGIKRPASAMRSTSETNGYTPTTSQDRPPNNAQASPYRSSSLQRSTTAPMSSSPSAERCSSSFTPFAAPSGPAAMRSESRHTNNEHIDPTRDPRIIARQEAAARYNRSRGGDSWRPGDR